MDKVSRFLLCRATGGLNDQLCQLSNAWTYCQKTGRVLIADTYRGGLGHHLNTVFKAANDIVCFSQIEQSQLDRMTTYPPDLAGTVSHYRVAHIKPGKRRITVLKDTETPVALNVLPNGQDMSWDDIPDYKAQLVLHHSGGGGFHGVGFLRQVKLKSELANQVLAAIQSLPQRLIGVHIRSTDISGDSVAFLEKLNMILAGEEILICSDNADVKSLASSLLDKAAGVYSVSDIPDLDGTPLHKNGPYKRSAAALAAILTDLIALASCQEVLFPVVRRPRLKTPKVSGFAILARELGRDLGLQKTLLSEGSNDALHHFFEQGPAALEKSNQKFNELTKFDPRLSNLAKLIG